MLSIQELPTPLVVVDLDKLEFNIKEVAKEAKKHNKQLFPMVKTHKSVYVANLQKKAGAGGFLCGTIDEAEALAEAGLGETLMLAYPVVDKENFSRVARLIEDGLRVIFRIDSVDTAEFLDAELKKRGLRAEFTIIVDTGGGRYGIEPEKVGNFAKRVEEYSNLEFVGITTHPGHVYNATNPKEVRAIAKQATKGMKIALSSLRQWNMNPEIVGTGSTPTFRFDIKEEIYTHLFPGNYVYYDRQQALIFGSTNLERCALTIFVTVTSIAERCGKRLGLINAGSLYFDKRGHEILASFGQVAEYPKATLIGLSQEVGKIDVTNEPDIKVGEKINVIPNHSCFSNNATSYIIGHRKGIVRRIIKVTARSGSNMHGLFL